MKKQTRITTADLATMRSAREALLFEPPKPLGTLNVYFDGGCSPNPGHKYGSFEVWFYARLVASNYQFHLGYGTNNEAEWEALGLALDAIEKWVELDGDAVAHYALHVETDSKILWYRLTKKNRVHKKWAESSGRMFAYASAVLERLRRFHSFTVEWKQRDANVARFGH